MSASGITSNHRQIKMIQKHLTVTHSPQASLLVYTQKNFFGWGLWIFCEWRHKWSNFWSILAHVTWPRAQPLGKSILLKFLLEPRLEFESFEPLIYFLAFLVQKLW